RATLDGVRNAAAGAPELELVPGDNLEIEDVFSYGARQDGAGWIVPIADLRAGDTRKIVARFGVKTSMGGALDLAPARLVYRPVDAHQQRTVTAVARAQVTDDAQVVR